MDNALPGGKWLTAILFVYTFVHLVPHLSPFILMVNDHPKIASIIELTSQPDLFPEDSIIWNALPVELLTAPTYYLLTTPLSFLFSGPTTIKLMGLLFTVSLSVFCLWLPGRGDNRLLCLAVPAVFLHLSGSVSPLVGIKRSAATMIIVGSIAMEAVLPFWLFLIFLAACSGLYAPAALIVLGYVSLKWSHQGWINQTLTRAIGKISMAFGAFITPLIPYFVSKFWFSGAYASGWVKSVYVFTDTLYQLRSSFLAGPGRGALFRHDSGLTIVLIGLGLSIIERLWLGRDQFRLRPLVGYLFVASISLWLIAHAIHPHIYQPFKYTRNVLPLVALILCLDNIGPTIRKLSGGSKNIWGVFVVLGGVILVGLVTVPVTYRSLITETIEPYGLFRTDISTSSLALIPGVLFVAVGLTVIYRNRWFMFCTVPIVLATLFYPHCFTGCSFVNESGVPVQSLDSLWKTLRSTPMDTKIAGPPGLMNLARPLGKRSVYVAEQHRPSDMLCDRMDGFSRVYYSKNKQDVIRFLQKNQIDYLLIDRSYFHPHKIDYYRHQYLCDSVVFIPHRPALDHDYKNATWRKGNRLYLVKTQQLVRKFGMEE